MTRFTLTKQERLASRKEIESLFNEGYSFSKYPLRVIWRESSDDLPFPARVLFSVSKKKFPRSVDRNRIKRLMREAYRLQKPDLYDKLPFGRSFQLGFIYTGTEIHDFQTIQKGLAKALERLITLIPQE